MSAVRDAKKKVAKANHTVDGDGLGWDLARAALAENTRAIHFEVEVEGKSILNSLFVYTDKQINYLMNYNKNDEVTEESSYTILMDEILPQCLAFIDNRLEFDSTKMSKDDVKNELTVQLMMAVGSHTLANEYCAVLATVNDAVFNLKIAILSNGEVEINGYNPYKGVKGYQALMLNKGINNLFNQVKNKINFPSKSMVILGRPVYPEVG